MIKMIEIQGHSKFDIGRSDIKYLIGGKIIRRLRDNEILIKTLYGDDYIFNCSSILQILVKENNCYVFHCIGWTIKEVLYGINSDRFFVNTSYLNELKNKLDI